MPMTSKQRMLKALDGGIPDRLPATTHHVMPYFLRKHMNGISIPQFFQQTGLDAYHWIDRHRPDETAGEYYNPNQGEPGFLQNRLISSKTWHIEWKDVPGQEYLTTHYRFITPGGTLTMTLQSNEQTAWVIEKLIKNKSDIDLIAQYATTPKCDVEAVNIDVERFGQRGLVRGILVPFDVFGQAGVWQDAACLVGIERLIMETFDDPQWVHALLKILHSRKKVYLRSMKGVRYDLLEMGGGDASSTVISPKVFDDFVAPYDADLIVTARDIGIRTVYHTCGGMMPLLDRIAAMQPTAMETFTPSGMGGDVDLAEARRRIPRSISMIGGLDQLHFFTNCTAQQTRNEVRRCFEAAGENGAYIISPCDHFFDADPGLVKAFADEAAACVY